MNLRVAVLVLVAALLGFAAPAGAATPEGPRLAILVSNGESAGVITTGPSGEGREVLADDPDYWGIGDRLSWSADGELLAFSAAGPFPSDPGGRFGTGWPLVAVARASGGSRVFPRAFLNGGEPVAAPDGRSVAFQRVKYVKALAGRENYLFESAIFVLDIEDGSVKRLTRWRRGPFLDPVSYSPDGSTLIVERLGFRDHRMVGIDLDSLRRRPLALLGSDVREPTYASDGNKLAFVRLKVAQTMLPKPERPVSELMVARADGTAARRILRRKGYISSPSWDPSGSRIAFTYDPPAEATGSLEPEPGNKVMAINADGTCLTRVFSDPDMTLGGSAWRPGVGREAGPIAC